MPGFKFMHYHLPATEPWTCLLLHFLKTEVFLPNYSTKIMIFNEIVCVKHVAKPFAPGKDPIITAIINIVGFGILLIVT